MYKITFIFVVLILLGFSYDSDRINVKSCKKGDFEYMPAEYHYEIFMIEEYQFLFDSILSDPIYNCFCEQNIKNLPTKLSRKEKNPEIHKDSIQTKISIEPIFIDLKTNDGLYGMRKWKSHGIHPRFRCGYWHFLFVISGYKYIPLTNDLIKNIEIVNKNLSKSFSKKELKRIIDWDISRKAICNDYTFLWPELIKDDSVLIWDLEKGK